MARTAFHPTNRRALQAVAVTSAAPPVHGPERSGRRSGVSVSGRSVRWAGAEMQATTAQLLEKRDGEVVCPFCCLVKARLTGDCGC